MKKIYAFISFFLFLTAFVCAQSDIFRPTNEGFWEPITLNINSDTLNQTDEMGRKQGYWKKKIPVLDKWILVEEGNYLNNIKSGYWKEYYNNGNLKNKIFYADGRPNGPGEMFYENGTLREKGIFIKNRWIGDYTLYYQTKQIQHKFHFNEKGKRDGRQYYFFQNGIIAIESDFINGKDIETIEYYESGKLKEKTSGDSLKIKFYESGVCNSVEHLMNGKKNGFQFYYNSKGNLNKKVSYLNGKMNGTFVLYHPNGIIQVTGNYENGHMSGERKYYDENGKLIKGKFAFYHENGKVERDGWCASGKPEGNIFVYDTDGKITMSVEHKNGKPNGRTWFYNKDGQPYLEEEYKDGVFDWSRSYEYVK